MLSGFLGEEKFFNGVHVSFYTRSYSEEFEKVGILKTSAKFTGKRQYRSLLFNRIAAHLRWSFYENRSFLVNFPKFLTPTLKSASEWLLQSLIILIIGIELLLKFLLALLLCYIYTCFPYEINPLSANPTKWSNTPFCEVGA